MIDHAARLIPEKAAFAPALLHKIVRPMRGNIMSRINKDYENSTSPDLVKSLFTYNPITGEIKRKENGEEKPTGSIKSTITGYKFLSLSINGRETLAHRVAWCIHYGEWPSDCIDHINGDPLDNRLENLREVEHGDNMKNMRLPTHNSSGFSGVSWQKGRQKWEAYISVNNRKINLGRYDTIDQAVAARIAANVKHGFHPNHGRR